MKRLIEILASGVTDDTGAVLADGTVTFYEAGTTTLKTVYEDWDLEDPHSNPATLDGAGRLIAYVDERVKIVISNAQGAVIRTIDHVGTSDSDVDVASQATFLSGMLMPYGGGSIPSGWLACDGSAISRTTYASLFTAISTAWGSGDGTTTFNVPDLRGRALIGDGSGSGLTSRTLGQQTIGAETHTVSAAEMPTHTHTGTTSSDGAHTHTITPLTFTGGGTASRGLVTPTNADPNDVSTNSSGAHTHTFTTASAGSGSAHNNMQPSAVVKWIIKT